MKARTCVLLRSYTASSSPASVYVYRTSGAAGRLSGYAGSCISHTAERRIPLSGPYSVPGSVSGNAEAERGRELSEEDSEEVRASSARCACVVSTRRNSRPAPSVTPVISPARSPAASRRYVSVRPKRSAIPVSTRYGGSGAGSTSSAPGTRSDHPSIHHGPCALLVAR